MAKYKWWLRKSQRLPDAFDIAYTPQNPFEVFHQYNHRYSVDFPATPMYTLGQPQPVEFHRTQPPTISGTMNRVPYTAWQPHEDAQAWIRTVLESGGYTLLSSTISIHGALTDISYSAQQTVWGTTGTVAFPDHPITPTVTMPYYEPAFVTTPADTTFIAPIEFTTTADGTYEVTGSVTATADPDLVDEITRRNHTHMSIGYSVDSDLTCAVCGNLDGVGATCDCTEVFGANTNRDYVPAREMTDEELERMIDLSSRPSDPPAERLRRIA